MVGLCLTVKHVKTIDPNGLIFLKISGKYIKIKHKAYSSFNILLRCRILASLIMNDVTTQFAERFSF